jgi:hypothetical protein
MRQNVQTKGLANLLKFGHQHLRKEVKMKNEQNGFDMDDWLNAFNAAEAQPLTERDWNDYLYVKVEDEYTERDYQISFYDMGVYGEQIVRACDEEFAIDAFLTCYQSKIGYPPFVARCETLYEVQERIAAGDTGFPEDGQVERYGNFGNAYYEALNN